MVFIAEINFLHLLCKIVERVFSAADGIVRISSLPKTFISKHDSSSLYKHE